LTNKVIEVNRRCPRCNALFALTAKLCCVCQGLQPRDVSRGDTEWGGASALQLRPCLRCLLLTDIPQPDSSANYCLYPVKVMLVVYGRPM